jgi:hypothetical protein
VDHGLGVPPVAGVAVTFIGNSPLLRELPDKADDGDDPPATCTVHLELLAVNVAPVAPPVAVPDTPLVTV